MMCVMAEEITLFVLCDVLTYNNTPHRYTGRIFFSGEKKKERDREKIKRKKTRKRTTTRPIAPVKKGNCLHVL